MQLNKASWLSAVLLFSLSQLCVAQAPSFWRTSILADLTEAEVVSFKATIKEALDKSPDADVIEWSSPSGSIAGKIRPRYTYESNGLTCRRTAFQVSEGLTQGRKENYRFDICKGPEGWGVYSTPIHFSEIERPQLDTFVQQALEHEDLGQPVSWLGKESGITVVVVTLSPLQTSDDCRLVAASFSTGDGHSVTGQYRFCENADKQWHYLPE
jgi:surface antigen